MNEASPGNIVHNSLFLIHTSTMPSPIYSQIATNKRKTALLILLFVAFIVAVGWAIGTYIGDMRLALAVAFAVALGQALISYYAGDKMAIWTSGARPVSREQATKLHRQIENLAIAAGIQKPAVYLIQDPAINAFATGRDPKHATIAVTTGAIEKLEDEELEGVLAHELSHVKNFDIRVMTLVVLLVGTIILLTDFFFRMRWMGIGSRDDRRGGGNPLAILAIIAIIISPIVAQLIQLAVSRKREYLADASGALLTRFPDGLARALEKIKADARPLARASKATAHLYISNPFSGRRLTTLFSTHPPLEERIKLLRQMTN